MRCNTGTGLGCVQAKLIFSAIEISRPIEPALNGLGLFIAGAEIDWVIADVFERAIVARSRFVNGNALVCLSRRVMGFALALALLVDAGLVLLGELLGLSGLLLGLLSGGLDRLRGNRCRSRV